MTRTQARATHKEWCTNYDVHGPLDDYCTRCGVNSSVYSALNYGPETLLTCDQVLARRTNNE